MLGGVEFAQTYESLARAVGRSKGILTFYRRRGAPLERNSESLLEVEPLRRWMREHVRVYRGPPRPRRQKPSTRGAEQHARRMREPRRSLDRRAVELVREAEATAAPFARVAVYRRAARLLLMRHGPSPLLPRRVAQEADEELALFAQAGSPGILDAFAARALERVKETEPLVAVVALRRAAKTLHERHGPRLTAEDRAVRDLHGAAEGTLNR